MTTRFFCCLILTLALTSSLSAAEWYRGNIHMHSFWSDGNVYPEQAVDWYKNNGYHFVVLSDHSTLQLDTQKWIDIETEPQQVVLTKQQRVALFEKFAEKYGIPDTREWDDKPQVRLSTIHELKKRCDVPGRFLMIPGHEINSGTNAANGVTLHGNAINVTETIPLQLGESLEESIDKNALAVKKNGEEQGHSSIFMLNHPMWPYYDIDPISMIRARETRLYEFLCAGGGVRAGYEESDRYWNRESLWDIVTAFRVVHGLPLMYGVGTDDAHDYTHFRDRGDNPGQAWIYVRAEKLEPNSIVQALSRGDFYISNGVELENVAFDKATGTLSVKVKPVAGVKYRILFIGTKKDFNQTVVPFQMEQTEKNPARKGWTFSKDIGIGLAVVEGTEASYRLKPEDLYVRAVIISDQRKEIRAGLTPETSHAWTQPFCP
jgi:hypothetical protein